MERILINNLGPLRNVNLELRQINLFMGHQSSGKSTLVKVICFFRWLEKRFSLLGEVDESKNYVARLEELKTFHRLTDEYFSEQTKIEYFGKYITAKYTSNKGLRISLSNGNISEYSNNKLEYIPAERNFVSVIPNVSKYAENRDNLLNFIHDWYDIKKKYSTGTKLNILNLGAEFYHSEDKNSDNVKLKEGKEISLNCVSSGLQSIIPLISVFDYLSKGIYEDIPAMSAEKQKDLLDQVEKILRSEDYSKDNNLSKEVQRILDLVKRKNYNYTQFFIEEPEQNLFPSTQIELMYFILQRCVNSSGLNHHLFITTHSPYILYGLNNCMLGNIIESKIPTEIKDNLNCKHSFVSPNKVGVWEIQNGDLINIQDEDGLIGENYFDKQMKEVMDDYYTLLEYFEEEE